MISNKENMIKILTLIIIAAFVVVSCFVCFEIYSVPIVDTFDVPSRYEAYNNNPILSIIFAIFQSVFILANKKWARIGSVIIASISSLATIGEVLSGVLTCIYQPIGGLSSLNFRITILGYLALFLAFLNVFIQVYSLVKCRKRSENDATYNYPVSY